MTREFWWSARVAYPGREPFLLGSVRATGDEHARSLLPGLWQAVSPHPMPEVIAVLRGRLVLLEEAGR